MLAVDSFLGLLAILIVVGWVIFCILIAIGIFLFSDPD